MRVLAELLRLALLTCIGTAIVMLVLTIQGCGMNGHGLISEHGGPSGQDRNIHCTGARCP